MNLDQAFINAVKSPICSTWSYISADAGRTSNSGAMELVLDADRLTMVNRDVDAKKAAELLDEAFKEHGYTKVSRFLCKNIKLT